MDYEEERDWFVNDPLAAHDAYAVLQNRLEEARVLIDHITQDGECRFDHHGDCQEHIGGFMDGGCWQPRAQAWLKGTE